MRGLLRILWLAFIVMVISSTSYVFASSGSGSSPKSGEGSNTISGWNISNVQYRSTNDPTEITAVEFDLDGSASTVRVSLDSSNPVFFQCGNSTGTHWVCNLQSRVSVSNMNELRVIATGSH
jgi:hypothetical protein